MKIIEPEYETPETVIPVLVVAETQKNRDYIFMGLICSKDYRLFSRGQLGTKPILLHDAFCVIRYDKESGSLQGIAADGPAENSTYRFTRSKPLQHPVGMKPIYMTALGKGVWEKVRDWPQVQDQ